MLLFNTNITKTASFDSDLVRIDLTIDVNDEQRHLYQVSKNTIINKHLKPLNKQNFWDEL